MVKEKAWDKAPSLQVIVFHFMDTVAVTLTAEALYVIQWKGIE